MGFGPSEPKRPPPPLLIVLLLIAVALQLWVIGAQSMSGDGAYHLLAGHQALRYGQNLINLEHPPLVKLMVSAPLLLEDEPLAPPAVVEQAIIESGRVYLDPDRLRRVTLRARGIALVFFVLPLAIASWFLGRRFSGELGGWLLVLTLGLSFSIVPILGTLQTDTAVTCAGIWLLLAAFRFVARPDWRWAVSMGLALGLAMSSKFSGVLLTPTVIAAVLLAPDLRTRWRARSGQLLLAALTSLVVLHMVFAAANWRYDSEAGRAAISSYCNNTATLQVGQRLEAAEEPLLALERVDPMLAQWMTGLLGVRAQNAEGAYLSYALGSVTRWGRWWYFPVLLAFKTPLVLLLVAAGAVAATARGGGMWRGYSRETLLVLITASLYLATAMTSNYNLGFRHLLPVLPLLYLPLVRWLSTRPRLGSTVLLVLALEALAVGPFWMCATNTWWLGSHNPTRFALGTGNVEYRQNFIALAREVEDRGIGEITVLYPVLPPEVVKAYLPTACMANPGDPLPPGWYALNIIVEQLVPAVLEAPDHDLPSPGVKGLARDWLDLWSVVREGEDHGYVAGTFHLYRLPAEPAATLDR